MTRKNQIRLALGLMAAVAFGVSLLSLVYMSRMATRIADVSTVDARMSEVAESLSNRMLEARRAEKNFIVFFDSTYIGQNRRILDEMMADVEAARQISQDYSAEFDSVGMFVNSYRENIQRLKGTFRKDPRMLTRIQQSVIETEQEIRRLARSQKVREGDWMTDLDVSLLAAASKLPSETTQIFEDMRFASNQVFALSLRIISKVRASLVSNTEQAMLYGVRARRNILSLLMLSGLGLAVLIYFLPRRIFEPVKGILRALHAVGRGDVEFPMPNKESKDEFGELARSFVEATRKIRYFNDLITDKIVEVKRNQQRILEEIEEGVIMTASDYRITYMNQSARDILALKGDAASLKDISILWEPLQIQLDQIDKTGRYTFDLKINKKSLRSRRVSVIPRPGKMGKTESILVVIR